MLYFAYGSNMSTKRLLARVPSAKFVSVCKLDGYRMTFNKKGMDGSGKCTICATASPNDYVMGVVYDLDKAEKEKLDKIEGAGRQYFNNMPIKEVPQIPEKKEKICPNWSK